MLNNVQNEMFIMENMYKIIDFVGMCSFLHTQVRKLYIYKQYTSCKKYK